MGGSFLSIKILFPPKNYKKINHGGTEKGGLSMLHKILIAVVLVVVGFLTPVLPEKGQRGEPPWPTRFPQSPLPIP